MDYTSKCSEAGIDTGRYQIKEKDGNVRIYDKQTQENFGWILRYGAEVQVDEKSGKKFLINDFGNGFFMMQYVDEELENGLKEFFELEELPEKNWMVLRFKLIRLQASSISQQMGTNGREGISFLQMRQE